MIISLTGFMGCGKSSVGKRLSELLCCRFADLDAVIEEKAGCPVAEIFERFGEAEFRRMEKETLAGILENQEMVLALGGGAVMTEGSDRMVHESSLCIYLRTSVDELMSRLSSETDGRPLLKVGSNPSSTNEALRERILNLMSKRAATYERTAHHIIDTDGKSIDQIAREIVENIKMK
jgi:shikimate kinase